MYPADLTLLRIAGDLVVRPPIAGTAYSCIAAKRKKIGDVIFGIPNGGARVRHCQRMVSLWDMISNAGGSIAAVANVVLLMSQFREAIDQCPPGMTVAIRKFNLQQMAEALDELDRISSELSLDATLHSVGYGKDLLSRVIGHNEDCVALKRADAERLEGCLEAIRTNFLIQMNSRLVLVFDTKNAQYLQSDEPPFGKDVENAFPKAAAEISEAAKCLALERPTATVFHLMRAMELAVEALGNALGKDVNGKVWGVMLADISKAIEAMPKGKARDTWSGVHSHLYHVKQAWRNDTMHPKTTYTETEAAAVFGAVKSFMVELVPMLAAD